MPDRPGHPGEDPTLTTPGGGSSADTKPSTTHPHGPRADAPSAVLVPGVLVADRYRIVNRLGAGGMGEVWRADDLQLSTSVAIKLLPPHYAADPLRLDRLRAEVRLTRQVSHPNVCRVYDIVQASGPDGLPLTFLCMEFIDGEDLASLLRRIGRPSNEKSVQIARQLCFALAAAHEQGIIHRDLKPANVMLDGRGNVRLMDFGVAGLMQDFSDPAAIRAGTPAYMAPEQLAGREVTRRSDLYSLGLVLYELFTGRPAMNARSIDELSHLHQSHTKPADPSSLVRDLDPAAERVILRCIKHDPEQRPASALAVAAALPGGDPLAAAMAAGETPSPELVAASGSSDRWPHARAWLVAACVVLASIVAISFSSPRSLLAHARPEKSLDVLGDRAMDMIRSLGYSQALPFSLSRYDVRFSFLDRKPDASGQRPLDRRPSAFYFWLRAAPVTLTPTGTNLQINELDPFPAVPGEILVRTDTRGRLERFVSIPPRGRNASVALPPVDPAAVFALAELEMARFEKIQPTRRPPMSVDQLEAYRGSLSDFPDEPIVVHVGSIDSKLAYFTVEHAWDAPAPTTLTHAAPPPLAVRLASMAGIVAFCGGCVVMAIRNMRQGRADRAGAMRAALGMFLLASLADFFLADAMPGALDVFFFGGMFGGALWAGMLLWLFYLAFEPATRRLWPSSLVSWSRLLRGGFTDPLVGRHVLIGVATGAGAAAIAAVALWAADAMSHESRSLLVNGGTRSLIEGLPRTLSRVLGGLVSATMNSAGAILVVSVALAASRRRWVGYLALAVIYSLITLETFRDRPIDASIEVVMLVALVWALLRVGLVACIAGYAAASMVNVLYIGFNFGGPIGSLAWIPVTALGVMTVGGALAATTGRAAIVR